MSEKSEGQRQGNFFDICNKCKVNYDCCHGTRPPITKERRKMIEDYLKRENISVLSAFVEEDYVFPRENEEGYCIFHDMKTRKCKVHAVKPETCVAGPITFDINKKSGEIDWFIKMEKICPLAGAVYNDKKTLQKHLDSAKKELKQLVNQFSVRELEAILRKDEPETFKISAHTQTNLLPE